MPWSVIIPSLIAAGGALLSADAGKVDPAAPRDYAKELEEIIRSQLKLAPELYAARANTDYGDPAIARLNLNTGYQTLFGFDDPSSAPKTTNYSTPPPVPIGDGGGGGVVAGAGGGGLHSHLDPILDDPLGTGRYGGGDFSQSRANPTYEVYERFGEFTDGLGFRDFMNRPGIEGWTSDWIGWGTPAGGLLVDPNQRREKTG